MPMNLARILAQQAHAFVARVLDGGERANGAQAQFQALAQRPFGRQFHALVAARLAQDTYRRLRRSPEGLASPVLQRFVALGALLSPDQFAEALDDLGERWGAPQRRVEFPAELRMALGQASRAIDLPTAHRYRLSQAGLPAADAPVWDR